MLDEQLVLDHRLRLLATPCLRHLSCSSGTVFSDLNQCVVVVQKLIPLDIQVDPPLGVPDTLVGEEGDVALDGLGVHEAHGFLVAGLAEEALAGAEHDREDL